MNPKNEECRSSGVTAGMFSVRIRGANEPSQTALGEGPSLVGAFSGHCETSRMFVGTSIDVPLHFASCFAARCRPPQ